MSDVCLQCKMIPQNRQNCLPQTSVLLFSDCLIPFCTLENLQKLQNGPKQHICCSSWYGQKYHYFNRREENALSQLLFFLKKNHLPNSTTSISQVSNALHLHASSFPIHCPHRLHTWIYDANHCGWYQVLLTPQEAENLEKQNIHPWNLTWNLKRSPWKRRFLLETIIFRFHVKFRGSTQKRFTTAFPNYPRNRVGRKKVMCTLATLNRIQPIDLAVSSEFWNVATGNGLEEIDRIPNMKITLENILKPTHASPRRWHYYEESTQETARCEHLGLLVSHLPERQHTNVNGWDVKSSKSRWFFSGVNSWASSPRSTTYISMWKPFRLFFLEAITHKYMKRLWMKSGIHEIHSQDVLSWLKILRVCLESISEFVFANKES